MECSKLSNVFKEVGKLFTSQHSYMEKLDIITPSMKTSFQNLTKKIVNFISATKSAEVKDNTLIVYISTQEKSNDTHSMKLDEDVESQKLVNMLEGNLGTEIVNESNYEDALKLFIEIVDYTSQQRSAIVDYHSSLVIAQDEYEIVMMQVKGILNPDKSLTVCISQDEENNTEEIGPETTTLKEEETSSIHGEEDLIVDMEEENEKFIEDEDPSYVENYHDLEKEEFKLEICSNNQALQESTDSESTGNIDYNEEKLVVDSTSRPKRRYRKTVVRKTRKNEDDERLCEQFKTGPKDRPYQCGTCQKLFVDLRSFRQHNHTRMSIGKVMHECHVCQKVFPFRNALEVHLRTHTGEKPYVCQTCEKGFTVLSSLNKHLLSHTGQKPYHCEVCPKKFTCASALKVHIRQHTGEKPYICSECGEAFHVLGNLKFHILRQHKKEKKYVCEVCSKAFTAVGGLKQHFRTHSGERPFMCHICTASFKSSSHLHRHVRTHEKKKNKF